MKPIHTYVLLSTVLTGLSACSGSDTLPEQAGEPSAAITYTVGVSSRAGAVYTSAAGIDGFLVKALTRDGAAYIECDSITKAGGTSSYVAADGFTRYWPAPGTQIGFFATKGAHRDSLQWIEEGGVRKGVRIHNYKVAMDVDRQVDLLVANTGLLTAPGGADATATVGIPFRHALSKIVFRARNVNPALDVEITGIGLKHIQNTRASLEARFADGSGAFRWNLGEISVEDDREKPTFKIDLEESVRLYGSATAKAEPDSTKSLSAGPGQDRYVMYMIPQTLKPFHTTNRPHGSSLMLCVRIWNVADDDGVHDRNDKMIWGDVKTGEGEWMMLPCSDTWLPGECYVYTVTFGTEGSNGGYQEDETKPDKDRVFDPIGFNVTIAPWNDGGNIQHTIK